MPKNAKQKIHCLDTGYWDSPLYSCGAKESDPEATAFIFGGITALQETAPWHVGIYKISGGNIKKYELICGGSLISSRLVATAGHCFSINRVDVSQYKVVIGSLKRTYDTKRGQHFNIVHFEIAEG